MSARKFTKKNLFTHSLSCILPSFSQNASRLLLLKRLWKSEHNFFQWKVVLLLIYCSITIYLSQLSPCWVWHLTFFWEQFLSNKLESFVSCNIKHFALCFDMYFFYKNLIILHHRDNNFLFWHLWSNSHFQQ